MAEDWRFYMGKLYQVTLPDKTFGIEIYDDTVIATAPIAKWMIGKDLKTIQDWVKGKRGSIEPTKEA